MKRDKPGLRKGDPDSARGGSNVSFHVIYEEPISIYRDLPITWYIPDFDCIP